MEDDYVTLRLLIAAYDTPRGVGIQQQNARLVAVSRCCTAQIHADYKTAHVGGVREWWICSACKSDLFSFVPGDTPPSSETGIRENENLDGWVSAWVGDDVEVVWQDA